MRSTIGFFFLAGSSTMVVGKISDGVSTVPGWTNHQFLSTPHCAVNRNPGRDRYSIPFFFDTHIDYPMACLPTCCSPDNPARYEPITYAAYMEWFSHQYDHVRESAVVHIPEDPGVPEGSPSSGTDFARGFSDS